jgi:hypothetical protein
VTESWLKARNTRCWLETEGNISIDAAPTQGAESISSATPDSLSSRIRSWEWSINNAPEWQLDNLGVDLGRRQYSVKISLDYSTTTEIGYYTAQDTCALDIDIDSGTLIAAAVFKYGSRVRIPAAQIKAAPLPDGSEPGKLGCDLEFTVLDNGTDEEIQCFTYIAAAALLA